MVWFRRVIWPLSKSIVLAAFPSLIILRIQRPFDPAWHFFYSSCFLGGFFCFHISCKQNIPDKIPSEKYLFPAMKVNQTKTVVRLCSGAEHFCSLHWYFGIFRGPEINIQIISIRQHIVLYSHTFLFSFVGFILFNNGFHIHCIISST